MTKLSLLLFLLFRVQSIWADLPVQENVFDIGEARNYADVVFPYCVENGFCTEEESATIVMEPIKIWLPQHAQIVRAGMDPQEVFEVMTALQSPPPFWRAGTARCRGLIVFNPQWEQESFAFYGSPSWRETLAHEIGHIGQGCDGNPDTTRVEWSATIMGLEMLASMDNDLYPGAYVALVEAVKGMVIGATIEQLALTGGDAESFVWELDLSRNLRLYFLAWVDWCENSSVRCKTHSDRYWRGPLFRMLSGYETISLAANQQGEILIDDLSPLLFQWFGVDCVRPQCVE